MELQDLLNKLLSAEFWNVVTAAVALAAAVTALTPSPADDSKVSALRKLLDLMAMNFGHAKNAKKDDQK